MLGAWVALLVTAGSCQQRRDGANSAVPAILRIGVSQWSASTNPVQGLRQLSQILVVEGLARTGEDGRMQPSLAEGWTVGANGRSLIVKLRANARFHDGSPVNAETVAALLPDAMKKLVGSVSDVESVHATSADTLEVVFRESSPFMVETLEAPLQKPNGASTGPFEAVANSTTELTANRDYYLGPPALTSVRVEMFPSVRTAWAEMLRGRTDMLWEVGPEALPSLEKANSISLFTFTRRYQYVIVLNPDAPQLKSAAIRRALNLAVDRDAVVKNALNSYGVASTGPIWPRNWAMPRDAASLRFEPAAAAGLLGRPRVTFSCLVPPDAPYERLALEVKRQLAAVGIDMIPEEVSYDEQARRGAKHDYEAMLTELISGPTLLRPYVIWHSDMPYNWGRFGNARIDAALDRVRASASDEAFRDAITRVQQTFVDDPPAVFLACSQRARAVSNRFLVPASESGRDILSNLRLWKPASAAAEQRASRN